MPLPKLLSTTEVAAYLEVTEDTLARWRAELTGPDHVKIGQRVAYPENAVEDYITSQLPSRQDPGRAAAAQMGEAARAVKAGQDERLRMSKVGEAVVTDDPYSVSMSGAGRSAGENIERHWNVPVQTFDNSPVPVAVANAQNGVVPVPQRAAA